MSTTPQDGGPLSAYQEAFDTKRLRVANTPPLPWCRRCNGFAPPSEWHSAECPKATIEDMRHEVERAREAEAHARHRAETWLVAVRTMHGKLALLKTEIRAMRTKLAAREQKEVER